MKPKIHFVDDRQHIFLRLYANVLEEDTLDWWE